MARCGTPRDYLAFEASQKGLPSCRRYVTRRAHQSRLAMAWTGFTVSSNRLRNPGTVSSSNRLRNPGSRRFGDTPCLHQAVCLQLWCTNDTAGVAALDGPKRLWLSVDGSSEGQTRVLRP